MEVVDPQPMHQIPGVTVVGASAVSHSIYQYTVWPIFIEFYEAHKQWLREAVSKDEDEWPEILRFCRVIRNSCSHGEIIRYPRTKHQNVSWRGITYSNKTKNHKFMFVDMTPADFVFLMVDMAEMLDSLGCPIL